MVNYIPLIYNNHCIYIYMGMPMNHIIYSIYNIIHGEYEISYIIVMDIYDDIVMDIYIVLIYKYSNKILMDIYI